MIEVDLSLKIPVDVVKVVQVLLVIIGTFYQNYGHQFVGKVGGLNGRHIGTVDKVENQGHNKQYHVRFIR